MSLCLRCLRGGFCRQAHTRLISDHELNDPVFRHDVQQTARQMRVSDHKWQEHVYDMYRDFNGAIVDTGGSDVTLDMNVFEEGAIREWFRDWIYSKNQTRAPRLRAESRERVRILATLIRAHYPERALLWGQRPANDN